MRQRGRARMLFGVAALATLMITALVLASRNWVCSSTESGGDSACGEIVAADIITDVILAVIGLGLTAYFVVKSVRATRRR